MFVRLYPFFIKDLCQSKNWVVSCVFVFGRTELPGLVCQWFLQWLHLPPKHQGLHGADRRPHRYGSEATVWSIIPWFHFFVLAVI